MVTPACGGHERSFTPVKATRARGVPVAVGVDDPVFCVVSWNVLLEHDIQPRGPTLRPGTKLLGGRHHGRARNGRFTKTLPGVHVFHDHRKGGLPGEGLDLAEGGRELGSRRGYPMPLAQLEQAALAGKHPRQPWCHPRNEIPLLQLGGVFCEYDSGLVVGRDGDRSTRQPATDAGQSVNQRRFGLRPLRWPHEVAP